MKQHTEKMKRLSLPVCRADSLFAACIAAAAAAALLLFSLSPCRESLKLLCNQLFAASEAVNAYTYTYLPAAASAQLFPAAALLSVALLSLLLASLIRRSRLFPFFLLLFFAGAEMWFGLTLPAFYNFLLFSILLLPVLRLPDWQSNAIFLLALLLLFAVTAQLAPGVNAQLELRSEAVRDTLGAIEESLSGSRSDPAPLESQKAREENRLHTQPSGTQSDEAAGEHAYRHLFDVKRDITLPQVIRYGRIFGLCLMILALLTVPFLPFLFFNAQRKRAQARRSVFFSDDCAQAVRAIFLHISAYLDCCGKGGGNLPFSRWDAALSESMSPDYAARYHRASQLFLEAAYSTHTLSSQKRAELLALLEETERLLYDRAGFRTKLRLKYVEHLHL